MRRTKNDKLRVDIYYRDCSRPVNNAEGIKVCGSAPLRRKFKLRYILFWIRCEHILPPQIGIGFHKGRLFVMSKKKKKTGRKGSNK